MLLLGVGGRPFLNEVKQMGNFTTAMSEICSHSVPNIIGFQGQHKHDVAMLGACTLSWKKD